MFDAVRKYWEDQLPQTKVPIRNEQKENLPARDQAAQAGHRSAPRIAAGAPTPGAALACSARSARRASRL